MGARSEHVEERRARPPSDERERRVRLRPHGGRRHPPRARRGDHVDPCAAPCRRRRRARHERAHADRIRGKDQLRDRSAAHPGSGPDGAGDRARSRDQRCRVPAPGHRARRNARPDPRARYRRPRVSRRGRLRLRPRQRRRRVWLLIGGRPHDAGAARPQHRHPARASGARPHARRAGRHAGGRGHSPALARRDRSAPPRGLGGGIRTPPLAVRAGIRHGAVRRRHRRGADAPGVVGRVRASARGRATPPRGDGARACGRRGGARGRAHGGPQRHEQSARGNDDPAPDPRPPQPARVVVARLRRRARGDLARGRRHHGDAGRVVLGRGRRDADGDGPRVVGRARRRRLSLPDVLVRRRDGGNGRRDATGAAHSRRLRGSPDAAGA